MQYNHIIFDIDGTMLNSSYADLTALHRVVVELKHRDSPLDELRFAMGIPAESALRQMDFEEHEITHASQLWNRYMTELGDTMKLFEGIGELIVELKRRNIKLGIITSKNRHELLVDFAPFGLNANFDTIITVEDSAAPKPSAEPMLSYIRKTGAQPHELLYIGDTIYDSQCAAGAGVDFALAQWGGGDPSKIPATHLLTSPHEVVALCQ